MSKFTPTFSKSSIAVLFCSITFTLQAQIFVNKGASIYTAPLAIVQVNGGIQNDNGVSTGTIDHNGTMYVTLNSILANPGNVMLSSATSVWKGNGKTNVEGNWVNNAIFQPDMSTVTLYASTVQQLITGSVPTTFHKLFLTGTGTGANRIKRQTINASVDSMLNINDRELATATFKMFVLNPDPSIVLNDSTTGNEGFVSSLAPNGTLSRATNMIASYNYPVGSSLGTTRYRPVRLQPNSTTADTFTVRFANNDANIDGFNRATNDGAICAANPLWYHSIIRRAPGVAANIRIYYKQAADGSWVGMSHWNQFVAPLNQWNDMVTINNGSSNGFVTLERPGWLFTDQGFPYIITRKRPAAPTVTCPTICQNGSGIFVATGGTNYSWTVPTGTTITNGQGTGTITVNWNASSGTVTVVDTSLGATCASLPASCAITPQPAPVANFDTSSTGSFNPTFQFTDQSTGGATTWSWVFGDGTTSTQQNPLHHFPGAGTYTVTQIVTSPAGCIDSIKRIITVPEGILIPNVFSPDGDGINDEFYIPSSGFSSFSIMIFNRWGTKIWEASSGQIRWDGHSTSGQIMSEGTYYFVLDALLKSQSGDKPYKQAGFVELLLREKK